MVFSSFLHRLQCAPVRTLAVSLGCVLSLGSVAAPAQAASGVTGTMLVAFGTSQPAALKAYTAIEAAFTAQGSPLVWAYTSDTIRRKMAKAGTTMLSIDEAMDDMARRGVTTLRVQSLHMLAGEEFTQLERTVLAHVLRQPGRFDKVYLGRPLLESKQDLREVVDAVLEALPAERAPGDAVVLMGHGQSEGRGDLIMAAARDEFARRDPLIHLATVEGAHDVDTVLDELTKQGVARVWLQPFMIVAGEHARNDMAGDTPNSWAARFTAAGMQARPILRGLGEISGVHKIFVRHARDTHDDITALRHTGAVCA